MLNRLRYKFAHDAAAEVAAVSTRDGVMSVIEYVTEEVQRQGHDTSELDGIERVGWMLNAWGYALFSRKAGLLPFRHDAIHLGQLIEPGKNAAGVRRVRVRVRTRVGMRSCPKPEEVPRLLELLFDQRNALAPLEFYKEFELIHPFVDGNGRTGKVLLNWLNGTLLTPIFPPADLFGHPIRNP